MHEIKVIVSRILHRSVKVVLQLFIAIELISVDDLVLLDGKAIGDENDMKAFFVFMNMS